MTKNRRQIVRRVFMALADVPDAERPASLDRACAGDAALRAEVEELLRADRSAGAFLASPTAGAAARVPVGPEPTAEEQAGGQIDRFKLLEEIGEGGMGTIWMAEQREPVKRRVALKIIKLGMDTKQVIARFEAERQALAMMDHPHIAKVFDAGTTETGRPYFVMEYIKGIPILEYCDQEKVDTKGRLELFSSVCHAIQHAHQKGIIHRDIKPTNVLVTMHDGVPVPKVIDFGIAKATNSELTTKTLFTEHRQMIGTPAYMSPEQAEMSGLDIDTRSDVYSLGVMLYELLTGTTPFDSRRLLAQGFAEMMRAIREEEPHKPSTRVSTMGDCGAAQRRRSDFKRLSMLLRGDLDWIVMKCLEKDRTRRYETANALAADIVRHLHDEPVTAGAPSAGYRLRKFVKRHRAQVIAGGLVSATLVLGLVGTGLGLQWALDERTKASRAAEAEGLAKVEAQQQARKAEEQATLAEAARQQEATARASAERIAEFMSDTLEGAGPSVARGRDITMLREMMDSAARRIEQGELKSAPEAEVRLRRTIGNTYRELAAYDAAEKMLAPAVALARSTNAGDHEATAKALSCYATLLNERGDSSRAEPLLREALEMDKRLFPGDHRNVAADLCNLAALLKDRGDLSGAEPLFFESLEMSKRVFSGDHPTIAKGLNNLALVLSTRGDPRTEALFRQALQMHQRLLPGDSPTAATILHNLAGVLLNRGDASGAESLFRESLEMSRRIFPGDHPDVASSLSNLARLLKARDDLSGAEPLYREALEMLRRLFPGDNAQVAIALGNLADLYGSRGDFSRAEQLSREALEMQKRLLPDDHQEVLRTKNNRASRYWSQGQFDKAIPLFEEVLAALETSLGRSHLNTLGCVANLAVSYKDAGRLAEAIPLLEEAHRAAKQHQALRWVGPQLLDAYAKAADPAKPGDITRVVALMRDLLPQARAALPEGSAQLAGQLARYAHPLLSLKAWDEAAPLLREVLGIRERIQPDAWTTFNSKSMLGAALLGQRKHAEAEPLLLDGYEGMKKREATIPPPAVPRIREALERVVQLYQATDRKDEAAAWRSRLEAARDAQNKTSTNGGKG